MSTSRQSQSLSSASATKSDYQRAPEAYEHVQNLSDFLNVWKLFYIGQVYIPTYLDIYLAGTDNLQATNEMGRQFYKLTEKGLICFDSQVGGIKKDEGVVCKAYINCFTSDREFARNISIEINRHNGMFAYVVDANAQRQSGYINAFVSNINVTYDFGSGVHGTRERAQGVPYSVNTPNRGHEIEEVMSWLRPEIKEKLLRKPWYYIVMVDTDFTRDILLDTLYTYVMSIGGARSSAGSASERMSRSLSAGKESNSSSVRMSSTGRMMSKSSSAGRSSSSDKRRVSSGRSSPSSR